MKKALLLLALLFTSALVSSQTLNQPSQFNNVCDDNNDGFASFYMQEIAAEITNNNANLVVTHHLTQSDAVNNVNPLPNFYTNISNPQLIFARVVNTVTSQVQITTYSLHVNPLPTANPYTMTVCETTNPPGVVIVDLNSTIPMFLQGSTSNIVTFYLTLTDAQIGVSPILTSPYTSPILGNQVFYVRIENGTPIELQSEFAKAQVDAKLQLAYPSNCTV